MVESLQREREREGELGGQTDRQTDREGEREIELGRKPFYLPSMHRYVFRILRPKQGANLHSQFLLI